MRHVVPSMLIAIKSLTVKGLSFIEVTAAVTDVSCVVFMTPSHST